MKNTLRKNEEFYKIDKKEGRLGMTAENLSAYLPVFRKRILFRNMTDAEICALLNGMSPRIVEFEKGETAVFDGDKLSELGMILSGSVHLVHDDESGNQNLMEVLGKGECFGELNAAGGYPLTISVVASEPTAVLFLNMRALLTKEIREEAEIRFLQNFIMRLSKKAQRLSVKLSESVRRTTRERITDYLIAQAKKSGSKRFSIPLNRQELADFLFVDRSALSNELSKMRREGILKYDKNRFELFMEIEEE